jgi:phosphate-selective porin OprO/OprP
MYNEDKTSLSDGTRIRRGRLSWSAQLYKDWKVRTEYDFTSRDLDIQGFQDMYLRYSGIRRTSLSLGNLKEPIGLEWQTSSKNITFMERSLPIVALLPSYHMGVAANTHGKNWSFSSGLFGESLSKGISGDNGWGSTGRFTLSPIHSKDITVHLGVSGGYRERGKASSNLRFDSRPESNVADVRFVDTHSIRRVTDYKLLGTEAAVITGPLSLQAEYLRAFANRNKGRNDVEFDGWYVMGSWFLTGESRNYDRKSGSFGRINPKRRFDFDGGLGAWELATRYSAIDLNQANVRGGHEQNVTVGLNWYVDTNVKLMGNYVFVSTDGKGLGRRHLPENPEIFEMRAQVEF